MAFLHGPNAKDYLEAWEEDRTARYGPELGQPSGVAGRHLVYDMARADPIFITEDMLQVVYSAMKGFDSTEEIGEDDFFIPAGFAYLPQPFYSITVDNRRLAWRAVSWRVARMWTTGEPGLEQKLRERYGEREEGIYSEEEVTELASHVDEEFVVRVTMWAHLDDEDDFPIPPDMVETIKSMNTPWLISHMTAIPFSAIPDIREQRGEGDAKADWLTFLRVLNRVMAEKIIVKERQQAPRPYRREAQRRNWPPKDVIVVELRRRTTKGAYDENSGRHYSHQWIVQGFWRNQYYPSMKTHRQKYIAEYVKGPKDKPLIIKDRVWNLDR